MSPVVNVNREYGWTTYLTDPGLAKIAGAENWAGIHVL